MYNLPHFAVVRFLQIDASLLRLEVGGDGASFDGPYACHIAIAFYGQIDMIDTCSLRLIYHLYFGISAVGGRYVGQFDGHFTGFKRIILNGDVHQQVALGVGR